LFRILITAILTLVAVVSAQDSDNFFEKLKLQIHGNAAQGFLFSSSNNYLSTESSDGSGKWTDGSLSVGKSITDKFRVGAQAHSYSLGMLGRQNITLNWAYADYKFNSHFGVRAGKVKTPFGLFNEVQDVDAVHQWALLPQGMYPADTVAFSLAHSGGVIYGEAGSSKSAGTIQYQAWGGYRNQASRDGFNLTLAAQGISKGVGGGPAGGVDVRWKTPLEGFLLGGGYAKVDTTAPDANISGYPLPVSVHYSQRRVMGQFERGKVTLSAEWQVSPVYASTGSAPEAYTPVRSWYTMLSYRAHPKLTLGTYYSHSGYYLADQKNPANYLKDVVVSSRYDFNRYFYAKLEGHYLDGNDGGFFAQVNPNGLQKTTRLLLARFGFAF